MNRHLQALCGAHPSLPPEAAVPITKSAWRKTTTLKKKKKNPETLSSSPRGPGLRRPPEWLGVGSAALPGTPARGGGRERAGRRAEGGSARSWCPGNPGTRLCAGSRRPRCALALRSGSWLVRRAALLPPVGALSSPPPRGRSPLGERVQAREVEREGTPGAGGAVSLGAGENPRELRGRPDREKLGEREEGRKLGLRCQPCPLDFSMACRLSHCFD